MRFTRQTIKSSYLVEHPDWYKYQCSKVTWKAAEDGTKNWITIWEGQTSPNAEHPDEMLGVPVVVFFNEKADFVAYPIARAANGGEDFPEDSDFNVEDLKDVVLEGLTKRGLDNNNTPRNFITEWRPVQE